MPDSAEIPAPLRMTTAGYVITSYSIHYTKLYELACLQRWQQEGEITLMIGDGVNDAPVLAGAHVSFAMAAGTDLAKTSADGILLGNQLLKIPYAMDMARQTRRIIRQNLLWALGYNLLVVPLAVSGHLPPYLAAIGMSLSSLLVVGNSMRLNRL